MYNRIVTLVDMDCFYCQVEARLNPALQGKPMAVVQYNEWKGGGIIAVNYEARDRGVTRHMRGDDAKKHCPEMELVKVPSVRGKADLTKYRDAGREVINVICEFSECVQRASIDEAYIDLTEVVDRRLETSKYIIADNLTNTFIVGFSRQEVNDEGERAEGVKSWLSEVYDDEFSDINQKRLALGAVIVEEMRAAIFDKTGFRCSAGIAHNKILAKLVCGLHKPNRQTVLPLSGISDLYSNLPVQKVRSLGGKFGNDVIEKLGCKVMADLSKYSEQELQSNFDEKTGTWLYNIARGIDLEPVTPRLVSKSIGCCKQFRGSNALKTKKAVLHWIGELSREIAERLEEDTGMNRRKAQQLTVSFQQVLQNQKSSMSRSVALQSYDAEHISEVAFSAIKRCASGSSIDAWIPPLSFLGISVGKFTEDIGTSTRTINQYFQNNTNTSHADTMLPKSEEDSEVQINNVRKLESTDTSSSKKLGESNKGTSFLERYIEKHKHLMEKKNEISNKDKKQTENKNVPCGITASSNSTSLFNKPSSSTDVANISISNDLVGKQGQMIESETVEDNGDTNSENADEMWVSPSEIFPDLRKIDEEVLEMLPAALQEKIKARILVYANSETDSNHDLIKNNTVNDSEHTTKNNESCKTTNDNSSPVVPSMKIVLTAQVHRRNDSNATNVATNKESECSVQIDNVDSAGAQSSSEYDIFTEGNTKSPVSSDNTNIDCLSIDRIEICKEVAGTSVDNITTVQEDPACKCCEYCNENIPLNEYQEHVDHHVAIELHKTLNSNQLSQSVSLPNNRNVKSSPKKNITKTKSPQKRKKQSDKKTVDNKRVKSILSFFSRK